MPNTSASGGWLAGSPVQGRRELENVFHDLIAGLTGLAAELVRPRYQPSGVKIPPPGVNWCAFGLQARGGKASRRHHSDGPARPGGSTGAQPPVVKDVTGLCPARPGGSTGAQPPVVEDGYDLVSAHQQVELLVSFYGPDAADLTAALSDGLLIWQNRASLRKNQIGFVRASQARQVPAQDEFGWRERWDLSLAFNRRIQRRYEVKNLTAAQADVIME